MLIWILLVFNSAHCCVWRRGRKRGDGVVSSTVGRKKEIVNWVALKPLFVKQDRQQSELAWQDVEERARCEVSVANWTWTVCERPVVGCYTNCLTHHSCHLGNKITEDVLLHHISCFNLQSIQSKDIWLDRIILLISLWHFKPFFFSVVHKKVLSHIELLKGTFIFCHHLLTLMSF